MVNGLFDLQIRLDRIDKNSDPLAMLNEMIDWELFRPAIETRDRGRCASNWRRVVDERAIR